MAEGRAIAMWSGPRNVSTAMMRAFANHPDVVAVLDEPFYGAYLAASAKRHPMRADVLASEPTDPRAAAARCAPPATGVVYQKHMAQHMLPGFDLDWMDALTHVFLIRDPARVVASFAAKWEEVGPDDLGFARQAELFQRVADRQGTPPPVIDAEAVRADPAGTLRALCARVGLAFDPAMLAWPPGPRASDGVWAAHWYASVERSTGFAPPEPLPPPLEPRYARLADAGREPYEKLRCHLIHDLSTKMDHTLHKC